MPSWTSTCWEVKMNHSDRNLTEVYLLNIGHLSVPFMTSQESISRHNQNMSDVHILYFLGAVKMFQLPGWFAGYHCDCTTSMRWAINFFFLRGCLQTSWRPPWRWHCNTNMQPVVRHMQGKETCEQMQRPIPHLLCSGELSSSFFLIICWPDKLCIYHLEWAHRNVPVCVSQTYLP